MTDAPERIWATYNDAFGISWCDGSFTALPQSEYGRYVSYIRDDLHQQALDVAREEGRRAGLEEAAKYHINFLMMQTNASVEKIVASTEAIRALIDAPADPVAEAAKVLLTAPKPGRALDAAVTASDGMPVGAVDTIIGTWLRALAQTLRIVVFKEGDVYVAQCLDIDVCTAATTMECLRDRMDALLDLELQIRDEEGQAIDPAPERFHKMWEHAGTPRTQ